MKFMRFLLFIFVLLFAGRETATAQTTPAPDASKTAPPQAVNRDETYRIGYQDTVEVQVFGLPQLSQRYKVNPDGTISLFRSRRPLKAVCKTERELAADVAAEYATFLKKPEVNVIATERLSQAYGVIGAVEKPGNYFVSRKTRLLELLAYAGGPSREAGSRLMVARTGSSSACREVDGDTIKEDIILMNFKIKDVIENKQNLWMQPGDIVSVLPSDVVYIYGNVKKEGPVTVKEPITLTQAIVSAEGFAPSAQKDKIRVLRQKEGSSEREELVYDLNAIAKRQAADPFLQPNDIVAVSQDSSKAIFRKISDIMTSGVPSLFYRIP